MTRRVTLLVALAALLSGAAEAGLDEWTSQGPFGGFISTIVSDPLTPTTLYAMAGISASPAAGTGLYRSTDAGMQWSRLSNGLPDANVQALAIDSLTPTTLYVGIDGHTVYRSTDAGSHWSPAGDGLPEDIFIEALAIDPQTPTTLYAAANRDRVYRSTDAGAHWAIASDGLPGDADVETLAIDPQTPTTLYIGTRREGVYRSMDGGAHWSAARDGLPYVESGCCLYATILTLAIDPHTPDTLYAGVNRFRGGGLFRSTDGGEHWSSVGEDVDDYLFTAIAFDPRIPTTLYAGTDKFLERNSGGVLRSTDGGAHWSTVQTGLEVLSLAIDAHTPTTVYAGTEGGGVLRSTDGGAHWSATNDGIVSSYVLRMAVDPRTPTTLYAGTSAGGIFKSLDGGATWSAANHSLPFLGHSVRALAVDPRTPTTLYAAISQFLGAGSSGVFRSTDGGAHWSAINSGLPIYPEVNVLAIDPQNPTTLYVGGYVHNSATFGVFKSIDGGTNWSAANDGLPSSPYVLDVAIDPQTPTTLYAATLSHGVYRSTDGGAQWIAINNGLPDPEWTRTLAIDPQTPTTLYVGTSEHGVFKSSNSGELWSTTSSGLPDDTFASTLAIDPRTPSALYVGTQLGKVFQSLDGGTNWNGINNGPTNVFVTTLTIDPATPSTLYAGTAGGGVFDIRRVSDQRVLSVHNGRFTIEVDWRNFLGNTGAGKVAVVPTETDEGAVLSSRESAVARFFSPTNWELLIKVLDGRAINDRFWIFLAAATDVELSTTVTDTSCGDVQTYFNPEGHAAPAVIDTAAFSGCATPSPPSCAPGETTFCLGENGRFQVETTWRDFAGDSGPGREVSIPRAGLAKSDDSGLFYFFTGDNWELLVKVLDGCGINDRFWVFAAATTNVEYRLRVTDAESGTVQEYLNPLGAAAAAITDTQAFDTCP